MLWSQPACGQQQSASRGSLLYGGAGGTFLHPSLYPPPTTQTKGRHLLPRLKDRFCERITECCFH